MSNVFFRDENGVIYNDGEQIFLINGEIIRAICDNSGIVARDKVLEIEFNRLAHTKNAVIDKVIKELESLKDK